MGWRGGRERWPQGLTMALEGKLLPIMSSRLASSPSEVTPQNVFWREGWGGVKAQEKGH